MNGSKLIVIVDEGNPVFSVQDTDCDMSVIAIKEGFMNSPKMNLDEAIKDSIFTPMTVVDFTDFTGHRYALLSYTDIHEGIISSCLYDCDKKTYVSMTKNAEGFSICPSTGYGIPDGLSEMFLKNTKVYLDTVI